LLYIVISRGENCKSGVTTQYQSIKNQHHEHSYLHLTILANYKISYISLSATMEAVPERIDVRFDLLLKCPAAAV
jgi:hypothetical protein